MEPDLLNSDKETGVAARKVAIPVSYQVGLHHLEKLHQMGIQQGTARLVTMPDVIYIHPAKQPVDFRQDQAYILMPVGVIGLLNMLWQQGFSVKALSYPLETLINPKFDLRAWLKELNGVHLVLIDLHWYEHAYGALDVAQVCKEGLPEASVILGGFTASIYAKEILEQFPEVDFIIRGDAERPLRELAQRLCRGPTTSPSLSTIPNLSYRDGNRVVENKLSWCATPKALDALNFVDTDFLEHYKEYREMQYNDTGLFQPADMSERLSLAGYWLCIGRGCQFDCAFCGGGRTSQKLIAGRKGLVLRSIEKVVDDLQQLHEMGVHQVSLSHDLAVLGREYWSSLFEKLRRRGFKVGIYNELFQLPSDEFIAELVQSVDLPHSELALTLLSGSEKVRRLNGKFFSNRKLFHVLSILKRHNVPIYVYFSLNLPGEDEKTFEKTLNLAERIASFYPPNILKMTNQCHTVDPYSPMSIRPEEYGIKVSMRNFMDYYRYCQQTCVTRPDMNRGAFRGFTYGDRRATSIEAMARKWDRFCAGQEARCFPVPQT